MPKDYPKLLRNPLITLSVPLCAVSMNKMYSGLHFSVRARMAKVWHETVGKECLAGKVKPIDKKHFPVCIATRSFFKTKNRMRDTSNCFLPNKLIEDGLVKMSILPDDSQKYVSEHIILAPVYGAEEDRCVVYVLKGLK